ILCRVCILSSIKFNLGVIFHLIEEKYPTVWHQSGRHRRDTRLSHNFKLARSWVLICKNRCDRINPTLVQAWAFLTSIQTVGYRSTAKLKDVSDLSFLHDGKK